MFIVYVIAFLKNENGILLIRRCNAIFCNGLYGLVGGKIDKGETARQAIRREVMEEVALDIPESNFTLVHTMHRKSAEMEILELCFEVDITTMNPKNNEPSKHDDIRFFALDALPISIIPAHEQTIKSIASNHRYSEHGW